MYKKLSYFPSFRCLVKKTVDQLGCLHPRLNLVVKGRADLDKPNEVEVCTRDNLAGPTAEAVEKMNKDR